MTSPDDTATAFADLLDIPYDPSCDPDVAMIEMIGTALAAGLTWAQIGSVTIGRRNPKAAKKHAKALGAAVRARAFAAIPQEALDA